MIDIILLVILLGYLISGFRQGLVVGVLSLGGFLAVCGAGDVAVPLVAGRLEPGLQRSAIVLFAVLLVAWSGSTRGPCSAATCARASPPARRVRRRAARRHRRSSALRW